MAIGFKFFSIFEKIYHIDFVQFSRQSKKNFVILKFPFLLRYFFRMIDEA